MPSAKLFVFVIVMACLSGMAFADSNVTFTNGSGKWQSTGSGVNSTRLALSGATLSGVSNLMSPYNCPVGAISCTGTVSLNTGTLASGVLNPAGPCGSGCTPAIFNTGGAFSVTSTGAGGGFTFADDFSSATWQKVGSGNTVFWTFIGQIQNGVLSLGNGMVFSGINAGTIQFSTVGGLPKSGGGGLQWNNNSGSTNFPSPVPEPGTLALFGSGMVALSLLTKRRLAGKARG
jgi:hypothetical protein